VKSLILRGVSTGPWDVLQNTFRERDFIDLANHGIRYVKSTCHLGNLVHGADYTKKIAPNGETCLSNWINQILALTELGIMVTPDISLSGSGTLNNSSFWTGSYADFIDLWGELATTFKQMKNIASLHPLHVPGHKGTGSKADWDLITDLVIKKIRGIWPTVKISWMPFGMGWADFEGYLNHTGYYSTAEPLPFSNIIYNFNHYASEHHGTTGKVTHQKEAYRGNIEDLKHHLQPAINFKEKYGVEMQCSEWGLKDPEYDWINRKDWIRDMIMLFNSNGFNWAYWNMAIPSGYGGDWWSILRDDHTWRLDLVKILAENVGGASANAEILALISILLGLRG